MSTDLSIEAPESAESWRTAKNYAFILDTLPPDLLQAIGILHKNHLDNLEKSTNVISSESFKSILMIDKTASLKIPLHVAASTLFEDKHKNSEDDTVHSILSVLEPGLFASLVSIVYLFRRANKLATSPAWETLQNLFIANTEMGFILGSSIPKLGAADGVLLGGIRFAALATFMLQAPKHYEKFKKTKHKLDNKSEMQIFGCNHCQVASILLHTLGFHHSIYDFYKALDISSNDLPKNPKLHTWRTAIGILDGLKEKNYTLKENHISRYFNDNSSASLDKLQEKLLAVLKNGSSFSWMKTNPTNDAPTTAINGNAKK